MKVAYESARRAMSMGVISIAAKTHDRNTIENYTALSIRSQEEVLTALLPNVLQNCLIAGGNAEARTLNTQRKIRALADNASVVIKFDKSNPAAAEWARQRAGELVEGATREMKESIRAVLSEAFKNEGFPPAQVARLIKESVALSDNQTQALLKARDRILNNPGRTVRVGKTSIHVPLSGMPLDRLDRVLERYGTRLRSTRALTIARTETIAAANEGQRQLWIQQVQNGKFTGREKRRWVAALNPCPICTALNGLQVGLNEPYSYGVYGPPAHPRCRCTQAIVKGSGTSEKVHIAPDRGPIETPRRKTPAPSSDKTSKVRTSPAAKTPTIPSSSYKLKKVTLDDLFTKDQKARAKVWVKEHAEKELGRITTKFPNLAKLDARTPLEGLRVNRTMGSIKGNYDDRYKVINMPFELKGYSSSNGRVYKLGEFSTSESTKDQMLTWRHEYGHHVRVAQMTDAQRAEWKALYDDMMQVPWHEPNSIYKSVTQYASSNDDEFFAESFAMYTHEQYGDAAPRLPERVEKFLLKFLGAH